MSASSIQAYAVEKCIKWGLPCRRPKDRLKEMHQAARLIGRLWRQSRITMRALEAMTVSSPADLGTGTDEQRPVDATECNYQEADDC